MGQTAAACVQATMKFTFERLSCLLLTYAIRFKPQVISIAMSLYGSKGAMYHGSMMISGMLADICFICGAKLMQSDSEFNQLRCCVTNIACKSLMRLSECGGRMTDDSLRWVTLFFICDTSI